MMTNRNRNLTLIGRVHEFNTRRPYTTEGQRITWAIFRGGNTTVVVFHDHSRMVQGTIDVHFGNLDLITDDWVLRAYDDFHYRADYALAERLGGSHAD